MACQSRFYHSCGHIGLSPSPQNNHARSQPSNTNITIPITLTFNCPFCLTFVSGLEDGEGALVILSCSTDSHQWHIIRTCALEDVKPKEWFLAHRPGGIHRHMAWIPQPCGEAETVEGVEEIAGEGGMDQGASTLVSCSWRQRRGEPFKSRFSGLFSQLNAALSAGDSVER